MPPRGISSLNPRNFQRHHLPVEHRHQPPQRAHEALPRLPPVHTLRPVDARDFLGQRFAQNFSGGTAFLRHGSRQIFALRRSRLAQLAHIQTVLLGKMARCVRGLAILISNGQRRSRDLFGQVGLRGGNPRRNDGKPPRRINIRDRAGRRKALTLKQLVDPLTQLQ